MSQPTFHGPILPGWFVTYRDDMDVLRGGADDRENGTVVACQRDGYSWTVLLTNGQTIPHYRIDAVTKTNDKGEILAAWVVNRHGYDGTRQNVALADHPPSLRPVPHESEAVTNGVSSTTGHRDGVTGTSAPGESEGQVGKTEPRANLAAREGGLSRVSNG